MNYTKLLEIGLRMQSLMIEKNMKKGWQRKLKTTSKPSENMATETKKQMPDSKSHEK